MSIPESRSGQATKAQQNRARRHRMDLDNPDLVESNTYDFYFIVARIELFADAILEGRGWQWLDDGSVQEEYRQYLVLPFLYPNPEDEHVENIKEIRWRLLREGFVDHLRKMCPPMAEILAREAVTSSEDKAEGATR